MNLSKSKYCKAVQCNKYLWLDTYKPNEKEEILNESVLDNGTEVGILAKQLFGPYEDIEFNENLNKMIKDTNEKLKQDKVVVTEASFLYDNLFCSVDILKKDGNNYEIYEVKSSTEISDIYLEDASFQGYVLSKLGLNIKSVNIVYLNKDYERIGDLDLHKLFNIVDITDIYLSKKEDIKNKINEINKCLDNKNEPNISIGMHCVKPYDCPFFKYCIKNIKDGNVFNIRGMYNNKKFELFNKGIIYYEDLLKENINEKYKEQIEFELYDKEDKINIENIKEFLNTLSEPLYFLDFETYQQSIPKYDHIKPYMQVPFQYSLHILKDGMLEHKEFLAPAGVDPRRLLAESLVKDIPKDVCTLAYNMSFEKNVIKNLSEIYPDLKEHLLNIYNNIKDLMIPFKDRDYYTKDMHGSYSIKYVLPALFPNDPELDYHNLDMIHNGSEAMSSYAELENMNEEEQEKVRKNLLKYCCLDTYAMVKIYEKLIEKTSQ